MCVCVLAKVWLFCSLLCGGLCAPIWRKSTLLLLCLFVVPFAAGLRHSGFVLSVHTVHIAATRTKKYSKTGTILFCCKMIQKCNICSGGTLLWSQCVNTNDALLSSDMLGHHWQSVGICNALCHDNDLSCCVRAQTSVRFMAPYPVVHWQTNLASLLTPSLPGCDLNTAVKVRNLKPLSLFVFLFAQACGRIFYRNA